MGAKNHALIMPDANPENVLNSLAGAALVHVVKDVWLCQ